MGGDGLPEGVDVDRVYTVEEMDQIRRGVASSMAANDIAAHNGGTGEDRAWSREEILKGLGISM